VPSEIAIVLSFRPKKNIIQPNQWKSSRNIKRQYVFEKKENLNSPKIFIAEV
jgi:hypothetical protein